MVRRSSGPIWALTVTSTFDAFSQEPVAEAFVASSKNVVSSCARETLFSGFPFLPPFALATITRGTG